MHTLITDKYIGTLSVTGDWDWSLTFRSPMERYPEHLWIGGENVGTISYNPEIKAEGMVRISAFIIGCSEHQDPNVEYEIHHAGMIDKVYVDTRKYKTGESDWNVLGTFFFSGEGEEYVQLNRVNHDGVTRASTICFEILNSALEGSVWQYLYVGPDREVMESLGYEEKHTFDDLSDSEYRVAIEYLASLGLVDTKENVFHPDKSVTIGEFVKWLSHIQKVESQMDFKQVLTMKQAEEILFHAAMQSNRNMEWLDTVALETADLFLTKSGIVPLNWTPKGSSLSRAEAAFLIKQFYHVMVASGVDKTKWKLTFSDDFDGDCLNTELWECENAISAHILSSRWEQNVKVSDGKLYLITKKEKHPKSPELDWTTASISVKPEKFNQCYGYWEASMKINAAQGLNNAFWMAVPGFEIDIVEAHYKNIANTNLHAQGMQHSERYRSVYDLSEDFHTYALEWNEEELIYYLDSVEISRKKNIDAHKPVFPFFSTAVLNWAGKIKDEADGKAMEVEWIRIYERRM